jgi:hypothetical protein
LTGREIVKDDKDFERKTKSFSHTSSSMGSFVTGNLYADDLQANTYWKVEPKAAPAKSGAADDDRLTMIREHMHSAMGGEEKEEEFWQKVGDFCRGKGDVYGHVSMTVSGAPAREEKATTSRVIRRRTVVSP